MSNSKYVIGMQTGKNRVAFDKDSLNYWTGKNYQWGRDSYPRLFHLKSAKTYSSLFRAIQGYNCLLKKIGYGYYSTITYIALVNNFTLEVVVEKDFYKEAVKYFS